MKPFLLLQSRPEDAASDNEYEAFLKYGGLQEDQLVRLRMEQGDLPEVNLSDYAGVLVGGGPFNVSDKQKSDVQQKMESWMLEFLSCITYEDFPYLGTCYGLGMLARACGATVSKELYSEDVSAVDIMLSAEGKQDELLAGLPHTFRAIVGHKESCQEAPEGSVLLAGSKECPYQMIRLKQNVYATQFHPELDYDGVCVRVDAYKNAGYFPPEDAQKLKDTFAQEEITIPQKILVNFVQQYSG